MALPLRPYWVDECDHGPDEFLGSVFEDGRPVDVYVFAEASGIVGTCVRFGDRPEDYRSGEGMGKVPLSRERAASHVIAARLYEMGRDVRWY